MRDGNFLRFVACAVVLNLGIYAGAPLFPLRWVDQLHLSDAWVSTFATAIGAASILGSWGSRVLAQRWEGRKVVGFTGMLLAIYPVATAQFDRPELIAVAAAGAGLFSGIVNVALFYVLTDVVPAEQRPRYIGVYTWLVNMAIFAGPLVGAAGVQRFGVESALLAAGAIRVLGGLLFLLLPFAAAELARRPAALEAGE